jgi:hypothetical protein
MLTLILIKIGFALLANSEATVHSVLQVSLNSMPGLQDPCTGFLSHLLVYSLFNDAVCGQNTERQMVTKYGITNNGEGNDRGRF